MDDVNPRPIFERLASDRLPPWREGGLCWVTDRHALIWTRDAEGLGDLRLEDAAPSGVQISPLLPADGWPAGAPVDPARWASWAVPLDGCDACHAVSGSGEVTCDVCDGGGQHDCPTCWDSHECGNCHGTGQVICEGHPVLLPRDGTVAGQLVDRTLVSRAVPAGGPRTAVAMPRAVAGGLGVYLAWPDGGALVMGLWTPQRPADPCPELMEVPL